MARFATFTVGSQVIVIPKNLKYQLPDAPENNYIDDAGRRQAEEAADRPVGAVQRRGLPPPRLRSTSSARCRPPRSTTAFMADTDPKKREKLVDELLGRKEFVEMWVMKWAELLQIRSDATRTSATRPRCSTTTGCRTRSRSNVPIDQIVQELLGANGGTFKNPATNYYQVDTRHAEAGREHRPGLHGHAHPVRPVPQPPVRPLDAERLLRLRRVLRAGRPQAGRGPARDDRLQPRRRRGQPPGRRQVDAAQVPRRRRRPT